MSAFGFSRLLRGCRLALGAAVVMVALAAPASAQPDLNAGAWNQGAQWLSLRFGYAREVGRFSANGNVGYGFGYSRMVSKRLSLGANLQHDLVGKFHGSALIELPLTFEALWHFRMRTPLHPYVGGGYAAVYRKLYRTGNDTSDIQPAPSVNFGLNTAVDKNHVLGVDMRFSRVANEQWTFDPVFLIRRPTTTHWSIKLNYALTY